jgi:hypothetical protein
MPRSSATTCAAVVNAMQLVLDGVFARDGTGALRFHATPDLTTLDVAEVLATVEPLIARRLQRLGRGPRDGEVGAPDPCCQRVCASHDRRVAGGNLRRGGR